jgi:hypothetical protein
MTQHQAAALDHSFHSDVHVYTVKKQHFCTLNAIYVLYEILLTRDSVFYVVYIVYRYNVKYSEIFRNYQFNIHYY